MKCKNCGNTIVRIFNNSWYHFLPKDDGNHVFLRDCQDVFPGIAELTE